MGESQTVICTFRVKVGCLNDFKQLLSRHHPTLRRLELATDTPEQLFVGVDQADEPVVIEIFEWADDEAVAVAHQHPDVAEVWEAMEPLCEDRHGRPAMEFPHFRPLDLGE